jgi:NTE family protein
MMRSRNPNWQKELAWDRPPRPQRLGIVLGGGAARGIAHIGALQVLDENGIYPQIVVGNSVGSLVGGLYAAGISPQRMATLLPDLGWLDLASLELPGLNFNDLAKSIPMGLLDLDKLVGFVDKIVGASVTIDQLNIPFAAVATDLLTAETVVINEGPLATAMRASCSVPGIFTPLWRNGRLLVDGVVVNNLPVTVAQAMGADYVVAIDVLPLFDPEQPERQAQPRNLAEVAMTALFMLARATQLEQELADLVVVPSIAHVNLADLSAYDVLIREGRRAMQAALPQLRADLEGRSPD